LKKRYVLALFTLFLANACSTKLPQTPLVTDALYNYKAMLNNSNVQEYAPRDSFEAQQLYERLKKSKNKNEAEHLATLLNKKVEIAKTSAKIFKYKQKLLEIENKRVKEELKEKKEELKKLKEVKEIDPEVKMAKNGLKFIMDDSFFKKDGFELLVNSVGTINKIADFLKKHPNRDVLIEGYMDNAKNSSFNIYLSLKRANMVADALKAQGINQDRIRVKAYGEAKPIASNMDEEGRAKNRRVEITILNTQ